MSKTEIKIVEVFSKNGYYHVKLSHGCYEMIYRAARGVYWDEETTSLYFKGAVSCEDAIGFIAEALKQERMQISSSGTMIRSVRSAQARI